MSKYSDIFDEYPHWEHMMDTGEGTFHCKLGDIPNCTPAYDIHHVDAKGHITILNPAPRAIQPWHPNFDVNAVPGYVKNRIY